MGKTCQICNKPSGMYPLCFEAYYKKKDDLGSELADIAIYLMGISQMLGFSLKDEINKKLKINENRHYEKINGILIKKDK